MLTKVFGRRFIPGDPGVPAVPETVVCTPPYSPPPPSYTGIGGGSSGGSGSGSGGTTVCTTSCIPIGYNPDGSIDYLCGIPVCRRT